MKEISRSQTSKAPSSAASLEWMKHISTKADAEGMVAMDDEAFSFRGFRANTLLAPS